MDFQNRLEKANAALAAYAVKHAGGLGRVHSEPEDETRYIFQRDRDRILHTQAFRRLKGKTQVFIAGHGDHYRTRITHTLEVAQISRDIARTLMLNEDLAEAIALAHDLGHTPFGHAGEEALNGCMKPFNKHFEHNEQSLRIVTVLEKRSSKYSGLNLSQEILEGLMKHQKEKIGRAPTLEAQLVDLADEIAYTAHDTDDGLRADMFSVDELEQTVLGKKAREKAKMSGTEVRGALVDLLVTDVYKTSLGLLEAKKIGSLEEVYAAKEPLIAFSAGMQKDLAELRAFLWKHLYVSTAVQSQAEQSQRIMVDLFDAYMTTAPEKVLLLQKEFSLEKEDAVKDYIAGMTDAFALERWKSLTGA